MVNARYLTKIIEEMSFHFGKMAFISGPRQVGKTTLAKAILADRGAGDYRTWDDKDFRKAWVKGPKNIASQLIEVSSRATKKKATKPLLILDELHKDKRWKQGLKGLYDLYHGSFDFLVTGSARLNIFKKGGDSLLGRYFSFRLHPFSVAELVGRRSDDPAKLIELIFDDSAQKEPAKTESVSSRRVFERLLEFGGFPDPYFNADQKFANLWRAGRLEKLIREDLRDLSRLPELSQVELMAGLLPDRVGSPLSIQSLREDIEVSHDTIKRWLSYLESLYYQFTIRPYSKRLTRALKKEPKIYLYDWSEIDHAGPRFENLVASHLLKACDFWTDSGHGPWNLTYLRNKEKAEVDFLITIKDRPILSMECKLTDVAFDPSVLCFAKHIGLKHHVQLVALPNIWRRQTIEGIEVIIASAERILSHFV